MGKKGIFRLRRFLHCFDPGEIKTKGTIQEVGPFAEGDNDQCPLCQYSQVDDIHPDIVFEDVQVDK